MTSPIGRRTAFAVPLGLLAAGAVQAAPISAIHPDAELISMVMEMASIDQITDMEREARLDAMGAEAAALDEKLEPFHERWRQLRQAVTDTPAHSTKGWLAKAEVIKSTALVSPFDGSLDSFDDELAWSLVKDLLRV